MLPREDDDELDLEPELAADELIARMLEYRRYAGAAAFLRQRLAAENGFRYRSAPLPPGLRKVSIETAESVYEGERLAQAIGDLLKTPPPLDTSHIARPLVTVEQRLSHLRGLLKGRGRFSFDEAVEGADRVTEAVTLFALLEMYKQGEIAWQQDAPFAPITISRTPDGGPRTAEEAV
jgi:segregation and condensation protein A